MGFELTIAVSRDPLDGRTWPWSKTHATPATVTLSGTLRMADVPSVVDAVSRAHDRGAGSVLVVMDGVSVDDAACVAPLGAGLMALRARGIQVQARCTDRPLHGRLMAGADARDWLLAATDGTGDGPRVALHLDASKRTNATD